MRFGDWTGGTRPLVHARTLGPRLAREFEPS